MVVQNSGAFLAHARAFVPKVKKQYNVRLAKLAAFIHAKVLARTPVNTGQTVANWQWSIGTPRTGLVSFSESGETGQTNKMMLGTEPRRNANQAIADASFNALPINGLFGQRIWLANNAPQAGGLERGELPAAPLDQRSPSGMLGVTVEDARSRLKAGVFK